MRYQMKELLALAYQQHYALPAINVSNMETVYGAFEAAYLKKSPIIIQVAPLQVQIQKITYSEIMAIIELFAKRYPEVKYCVHLDHCEDLEDFKMAYEAGFDSLMFDGSKLSYQENIEKTSIARSLIPDCTLEGELGALGSSEGSAVVAIDRNLFTKVEDVKNYVEKTKVDCLAISIGNAHGFYKDEPKLQYELLKEISDIVEIPLVLHGSSGIACEDIQRVNKMKIAKINFFTQCDYAFVMAFKEKALENKLMIQAIEAGRIAFRNDVMDIMTMCQSEEKQ